MRREYLQCLCFLASTSLILGGAVGVIILVYFLVDAGVPDGVIVFLFLVAVFAALMLCALAGRKKDRPFTQVSTPTDTSISTSEPVFVPVTILQITKRGEVVEAV